MRPARSYSRAQRQRPRRSRHAQRGVALIVAILLVALGTIIAATVAYENAMAARRELLTHVKAVTIRYLDVNHQWQDQWPPATSTTLISQALEATLRQRPLAVEITLDTEDWGKVVRIVEIAT